jgi:integrase/recombinase XerD
MANVDITFSREVDGMNLDDALEGWVLDLRQRRRTERTVEGYVTVMHSFIRYCNEAGGDEVEQLRASHLRTFAIERLGGLAPATQHGRVAILKAFGSWLEANDLVASDPFRKVKRPALDRDETPRALTPNQVTTLLGAYDLKNPEDFRDYVIVKLVLDTGMRRGEVIGLTLQDATEGLEEGYLRVLGKGRHKRLVPLSDEMKSLLWKYVRKTRAMRSKPGVDALFVTRRGAPLQGVPLYHRFAKKAHSVGVQARFHDLRHTSATWALRAGMPKERVSRMLGHSNDVTTSIYEHLDFTDVKESHAKANPLRLLCQQGERR